MIPKIQRKINRLIEKTKRYHKPFRKYIKKFKVGQLYWNKSGDIKTGNIEVYHIREITKYGLICSVLNVKLDYFDEEIEVEDICITLLEFDDIDIEYLEPFETLEELKAKNL